MNTIPLINTSVKMFANESELRDLIDFFESMDIYEDPHSSFSDEQGKPVGIFTSLGFDKNYEYSLVSEGNEQHLLAAPGKEVNAQAYLESRGRCNVLEIIDGCVYFNGVEVWEAGDDGFEYEVFLESIEDDHLFLIKDSLGKIFLSSNSDLSGGASFIQLRSIGDETFLNSLFLMRFNSIIKTTLLPTFSPRDGTPAYYSYIDFSAALAENSEYILKTPVVEVIPVSNDGVISSYSLLFLGETVCRNRESAESLAEDAKAFMDAYAKVPKGGRIITRCLIRKFSGKLIGGIDTDSLRAVYGLCDSSGVPGHFCSVFWVPSKEEFDSFLTPPKMLNILTVKND